MLDTKMTKKQNKTKQVDCRRMKLMMTMAGGRWQAEFIRIDCSSTTLSGKWLSRSIDDDKDKDKGKNKDIDRDRIKTDVVRIYSRGKDKLKGGSS